jgi:hypothetical protein
MGSRAQVTEQSPSTRSGGRRILRGMRFALVIAAAGVLALGIAAAQGGGDPATAAQAPLELRVAQLEAKVSGICTAFRTFDPARSYHDYDARFQTLIRSLQASCGASRQPKAHEDAVKPRKRKAAPRHEDRPPPALPPHEG